MFKVLVDTNVLLDLVSADRPRHAEAVATVRALIAAEDWEAHVLVSSLKEVYFIFERHYGDEATARRRVGYLMDAFELDTLTPEHAKAALISDEPDFEDGIVRTVAEKGVFDYILTRDKAGFVKSKSAKIEADALLKLLPKPNSDNNEAQA